MGIYFFDLRPHGGCQRPKTPLESQKWHEGVNLSKKVFQSKLLNNLKNPLTHRSLYSSINATLCCCCWKIISNSRTRPRFLVEYSNGCIMILLGNCTWLALKSVSYTLISEYRWSPTYEVFTTADPTPAIFDLCTHKRGIFALKVVQTKSIILQTREQLLVCPFHVEKNVFLLKFSNKTTFFLHEMDKLTVVLMSIKFSLNDLQQGTPYCPINANFM